MSNKDVLNLQKEAEETSKLLLKKKAVDRFRTEADYQRYVKSKEEVEALQNINIESDREEYVRKIIKENEEYMEAAKSCKKFITKSFNGIVPNFGKNINLIAANTNGGKSTLVSNIAFHTAMVGGKTLIITNEEAVADVYNRITCLIKGWPYANHNEFTDEQKRVLNEGIEKLSKFINVISDSSYATSGTTTTVEGIQNVLESVIRNNQKYDQIIIDYVQKISFSKLNPNAKTWEILSSVMQYLDGFKNRYLSSPITVMAQLHNSNGDEDRSFEDRLRGFKGIITPVTCAMEMVADKKTYQTKFIIHKNRWSSGDMTSQEVVVGWYKGLYVELDHAPYVAWTKQKEADRIAKKVENAINGK